MAAAIKFGLAAPGKISKIVGGGLLGVGLVMVITGVGCMIGRRRNRKGEGL